MGTDIKDTVAFLGFKCAIDCAYWYNKDLNPEFDFDVAGGYANFTDDVIIREFDKIQEYLLTTPVIIMISSSVCSLMLNKRYKAFNKHAGICSYRSGSVQDFSHMSMPDYTNIGLVFAVAERGDRKEVSDSGYHYGVKAVKKNDSIDFLYGNHKMLELPSEFHKEYIILHHGITDLSSAWELGEYLFETAMPLAAKLSISAPDLVSGATVSSKRNTSNQAVVNTVVSANDKSGRFDGIWELFKNKGKMADRYQKLIDALNSVDETIIPKLDKVLCDSYESPHAVSSISSAANLMGGD